MEVWEKNIELFRKIYSKLQTFMQEFSCFLKFSDVFLFITLATHKIITCYSIWTPRKLLKLMKLNLLLVIKLGGPVEVGITMYVISISSFSDVDMDFTMDIYFRQFWKDSRLAFEKKPGFERIKLGHEFGKMIWVPDTFFVNEKESFIHTVTTKNEFIRVDHTGDVKRSVRWDFYDFYRFIKCMEIVTFRTDHRNFSSGEYKKSVSVHLYHKSWKTKDSKDSISFSFITDLASPHLAQWISEASQWTRKFVLLTLKAVRSLAFFQILSSNFPFRWTQCKWSEIFLERN